MLLKFCGAAQEVTGSNYLVEAAGHRVLVDCGMHQGEREEANWEPFPYAPNSIDAIVLTHAHIDHSGRIPKLVREGFRGKIYATLPTIELTEILWDDSVRIMREDAAWQSTKNARRGLPPVEPLYSQEDADTAKKLLTPINYDSRVEIAPGISARFRDAGHILGSSIIELFAVEDEKLVRLVFSGDIGPMHTVMERAPAEIADADYVIIESTYGNREHKDNQATREEFQSLMEDIFTSKHAKVYIPTFVVDRAQRIMYELSLLRARGVGVGMPVYFDSPLGVKTTQLYESHLDLMSQEIQAYRRERGNPFVSDDIRYVSTKEESQAVNAQKFGVVLAGSGMCNGGRIVHHLKNGIWNPDNHIIFAGYQAYGTLGRRIVDGARTVRIAGETIKVAAQIHTIGGFSAHAGRTDLLAWAERFRPSKPKFFVTHGEAEAAQSLAEALKTRGFESLVPVLDQEVTLAPREAGQRISESFAESLAAPVPPRANEKTAAPVTQPSAKKQSPANRKAVAALEGIGDRLHSVYERAAAGSLPTDSQPLLDAVAVLLDSILAKKDNAS